MVPELFLDVAKVLIDMEIESLIADLIIHGVESHPFALSLVVFLLTFNIWRN